MEKKLQDYMYGIITLKKFKAEKHYYAIKK